MPPIVKDTQVLAASSDSSTACSVSAVSRPIETVSRPQAVALEVAVTVNGARSVDGSDKRETFSESTKTVLVHGNGAVIRLSSAMAPGQLLFLTNQKTKKEVVCQVIKSKSYRNVSGYVELEFTEPVVGFWGMRFPTDRIGSQPSPTQPVPARLADTHFPELRRPETPAAVKPVVPAAQDAPTRSAVQPASLPHHDAPVANLLHASEVTVVTASVPHETEQSPLPSSPALQSVPPSAENPSQSLRLESARVKQQLSALLFSGQPVAKPSQPDPNERAELTDATAKVVEFVPKHVAPASPNHAPAVLASIPTVVTEFTSAKVDRAKIEPSPAKSLLDSEEVKIPAWLEPLARNAATPAPLEESQSDEEQHHQELQTVEEIDEIEDHEKQQFPSAEHGGFEIAEPPSADRLLLGENASELSATSSRPNKGALIGAIAAGLLIFAVAGGWYAYHSAGAVDASSAKAPNTAATSNVSGSAVSALAQSSLTMTNSASNTPASATSNSSVLSSKPVYSQPASAGINVTSVGNANSMPSAPESPVAGDPQPKKAALGRIRLAAPHAQRNAAGQDNAEPELGFDGPEQLAATADPIGSTFGNSNARQPVAPSSPLPVGGNVKPAKLLSSVQPVYPNLAKSQHVAGDVKINALIDTNGRVTTMKVISGPAMLQQAAQDALHQWIYQPAMLDGKSVPMQLTVTLQFRLQ